MKKIVLLLIGFYQKFLSFDTGILKLLFPAVRTCRFEPRCSQYMYEAVERYGTIKGVFLGVKRILRCNGFSPGGLDVVPR